MEIRCVGTTADRCQSPFPINEQNNQLWHPRRAVICRWNPASGQTAASTRSAISNRWLQIEMQVRPALIQFLRAFRMTPARHLLYSLRANSSSRFQNGALSSVIA